MASAVQRIQDKLFGKASTSKSDDSPERQPNQHPFPTSSSERVDQPAPLTINIPKGTDTSSIAPQKKNDDNADSDENAGQNAATPPLKSYRERLAEKLGNEYKGVEKYRLVQDANRERHWKKWGPYLSDRQWVCLMFNSCLTFILIALYPRPRLERITRTMVMLGVISLMLMPDLAHTVGGKMASQGSVITTNASASDFPSGTASILSLKNAYLV